MTKFYLKLYEAETLIPKLEKAILRLKDLNRAINLIESIEFETNNEYLQVLNELKINKSYHKLNFLLYKEIEELFKMGAIIKDLNEGIVDFYSIFNSREILLCWKCGEKDIKFWHEVNSGFGGRKPIALLRNKID